MPLNLDGFTYCVLAFGCQMNEHDAERVAGMLEHYGAKRVEALEDSDILVYLTCCVRLSAETRLFGHVASCKNVPVRKNSPLENRIIAIGGCIAQRDGESLLESFAHVNVVFGTQALHLLPEMLADAIYKNKRLADTSDHPDIFSADLPTSRNTPWSAWLPIMTGCNNFCSYCIVPYVRGRERSRSIEDIVSEAEHYVSSGVKEITLLGQNVNSFGRDSYGTPQFARILKEVDATGIERLRFVTSHPKDLSDEVISTFGELRSVMPALHLPFQSGSNRVLKLMNRSYTREHYLGLIEKLRHVCPDIALSTDIIVGFPSETEDDFEQTRSLVEQVGFAQAFTFIFSPRSGTPAAKMDGIPASDVIQRRFDTLVHTVQNGAYEYNQKELGKVIPVLVEGASKRGEGILAGKSPKNQTVHAYVPDGTTAQELAGTFLNIRITEAKTWYLFGEVI
ncbi:tRNA (N6-isopentenyl adenosine(37)-C2)-methylthiotransferase MiaB [Adlercreutzia sp. ZJ154]|uniref:tRNA (N6-isopentenyl adenosine(37)-C2)-methylthiotransferase MiaB n=1 Tax=Adlercreutzia sp. ZJ154 TaxID=2709790 RepID=UPI0013E9CB6B|nr:tRNA (N6-isopentenyl adenosine(37)-C2)-methylthiotransferase MiaB [Adlercreutzia sp. ZJ154]